MDLSDELQTLITKIRDDIAKSEASKTLSDREETYYMGWRMGKKQILDQLERLYRSARPFAPRSTGKSE